LWEVLFVPRYGRATFCLKLGRLEPKAILVGQKDGQTQARAEVCPKKWLDAPEALIGAYRFTGRPAMFFQFLSRPRKGIPPDGRLKHAGGFRLPIDGQLAVAAAGPALEFWRRPGAAQLPKFAGISSYAWTGHLTLDSSTRSHLELN